MASVMDVADKVTWWLFLASDCSVLPRDLAELAELADIVVFGLPAGEQKDPKLANWWAELLGAELPPEELPEEPGVVYRGLLEDLGDREACQEERICYGDEGQALGVRAVRLGLEAADQPSGGLPSQRARRRRR